MKLRRNFSILFACLLAMAGASSLGAETISVHAEETTLKCDANADGIFNVVDIVVFQRWLHGDNVSLSNWKSVDIYEDEKLNVIDLSLMKQMLIQGRTSETLIPEPEVFDFSSIPEYNGDAWIVIGNNTPDFTEIDSSEVFEYYADLDEYGRCGVTFANVCKELMPTEERGSISSVKPTGWVYEGVSNNNKYDFISGKYIYNRCHLIGWQLTGENANVCNLITGTRYLNIDGMLSFENMVAEYIHEENNQGIDAHVLYRVTPYFEGDNLVASGVRMEAWSVEDAGESICFDVYCYNAQPDVIINYATGENWSAIETE